MGRGNTRAAVLDFRISALNSKNTIIIFASSPVFAGAGKIPYALRYATRNVGISTRRADSSVVLAHGFGKLQQTTEKDVLVVVSSLLARRLRCV